MRPQEKLGAYYTSSELTNHILEKAILKDLSRRLNRDISDFKEILASDKKDLRYLLDETVGLPSIRLLDPSVGEGAFLLSALKTLLGFHKKIAKKLDLSCNEAHFARKIIHHNLYGVDINEKAVKKCRERLYSFVKELDANSSSETQKIPLRLDFNILCGNTIIGRTSLDHDVKQLIPSNLLDYLNKRKKKVRIYQQEEDELKARKLMEEIEKYDKEVAIILNKAYDVKSSTSLYFHWILKFSDILLEGGFDIIIGNPPYISYYTSKKGKQQLNFHERKLLIKNYEFITNKKNLRQRIGTMMFFIERGVQLLKEDGLLFFVLDTAFYVEAYEKIRAYLVKHTTIMTIYEGFKSFLGVHSGQILLFLQKKIPEISHKTEFYDSSFKFGSSTLQTRFSADNRYQFELFDPVVERILEEIERKKILLLGDIGEIDVGYNVGGHPDFWSASPSEKAKPFVKGGSSIQKWRLIYPSSAQLKNNQLYLIYDPELVQKVTLRARNEKKGLPGFGNKEVQFAGEKIFLRQAGWELTGTLDREGYRATHNIFIITSKDLNLEQGDQNSFNKGINLNTDALDLRIVLASLNSTVCTYYAHKRFLLLAQRGKIPQITTNAAKLLPITVSRESGLVSELVEALLRIHNQNLPESYDTKIPEEMLELIQLENYLLDTRLVQNYLAYFAKGSGKLENELIKWNPIKDAEFQTTLKFLRKSDLVASVVEWTRKRHPNFLSDYFPIK